MALKLTKRTIGFKLIKPKKKKKRIRIRRPPEPVFDEAEVFGELFKYWAKTDKTLGYLRKRFARGHPLGDWLMEIAIIRLELRDA